MKKTKINSKFVILFCLWKPKRAVPDFKIFRILFRTFESPILGIISSEIGGVQGTENFEIHLGKCVVALFWVNIISYPVG